MNVTQTLDTKGLSCPMPIVKTKKAMDTLASGDILEVLATDKGAVNDLSAWSKSSGHELLEHTEEGGLFKFYIQKG
ncbi:sulfurtransferase TusA family protein [Fictibacillus phosphorivorans]|uniref:sulfurtransferase TusA family protein n=1 Tax=Fictibacillus phosphorivorans TaxID=1221500 RepID=UPI0035E7DEBA